MRSTVTPSRSDAHASTNALLAMTPSTLAALLAEASSASTTVANTFTLAAVTLREMSSGATPAALARPAMKLALSKLSTVPAKVNCSAITVCFISPGASGGAGEGGLGANGGNGKLTSIHGGSEGNGGGCTGKGSNGEGGGGEGHGGEGEGGGGEGEGSEGDGGGGGGEAGKGGKGGEGGTGGGEGVGGDGNGGLGGFDGGLGAGGGEFGLGSGGAGARAVEERAEADWDPVGAATAMATVRVGVRVAEGGERWPAAVEQVVRVAFTVLAISVALSVRVG